MSIRNRRLLVHLCLSVSGFFKLLAKALVPGMIVDELTVPGWRIWNNKLIKMKRIDSKVLKNCMCWDCYDLPPEYLDDLQKLIIKNKTKRR